MKRLLIVLAVVVLAAAVVWLLWPLQSGNPGFDASVAKPAYPEGGASVLFDEGHYNFHTTEGRYKPFADLIRNDGYGIAVNRSRLTLEALSEHDILISANPLGLGGSLQMTVGRLGLDWDLAGDAFDDEECVAVESWVRQGGALLLIADHAPIGRASEALARRFGILMSNGFVRDEEHRDPEVENRGILVFSRENGLLGDHPITEGRDDSERLNKVMTFTGQSLRFPPRADAFLRLSDAALDFPRRDSSADEAVSAAGRAQGVALKFGQGRVVVMGEAAALTSQIGGGSTFGISPENDNRQMVLNIMHWLSGLI